MGMAARLAARRLGPINRLKLYLNVRDVMGVMATAA